MLIYLIALLPIAYMVVSIPPQRQHEHLGKLTLWMLFVALVCGLGDMLGGYDRYIYGEIFDVTADDRTRGIPMFSSAAFYYVENEPGYAFYNYVLSYVTSNRYIFIFITTLLIYGLLFRHVKKYSNYPITAIFLFFCIYYFFTFTYLRQVMALCIAWFAIPFAVQRRPIPFFAIVALAMTFHNSALLFCGAYFVSNLHLSRKQIIIIIGLSLALGLTPLSSALFSAIGGAVNEEKTEFSLVGVSNARLAYIVESGFFLYFILRHYHALSHTAMSRCMVNIALGFIFVLCFFVRFLDGGRMSWYYLIGIYCTMAEVIVQKNKRQVGFWIILSVVIGLYLRVLVSWGILLRPYKTFLEEGVRDNDVIWEIYEYDHKYDDNKLYRPVFGGMKEGDLRKK